MKYMKKKIGNFLFMIAVFGLTLWAVFRGEDFGQVLLSLEKADWRYVIPGVACVIFFILGESAVIFCLMRTLGERVRFPRCFIYSFI